MMRFSKDADVLIHEALNPQMVEMLVASLDQDGHTRHTGYDRLSHLAGRGRGHRRRGHVKLLVLSHIVPPLPTG